MSVQGVGSSAKEDLNLGYLPKNDNKFYNFFNRQWANIAFWSENFWSLPCSSFFQFWKASHITASMAIKKGDLTILKTLLSTGFLPSYELGKEAIYEGNPAALQLFVIEGGLDVEKKHFKKRERKIQPPYFFDDVPSYTLKHRSLYEYYADFECIIWEKEGRSLEKVKEINKTFKAFFALNTPVGDKCLSSTKEQLLNDILQTLGETDIVKSFKENTVPLDVLIMIQSFL